MIRIILLALLLLIFPSVSYAQALSADQKTEIEALIKKTMLDNPEVIIKSVEDFRVRQQAEAEKKQAEDAQAFLKKLGTSKTPFMAGNPKGDVTVVEFFDYNCGYCRKAFEDIQALLKDDENVKIIFFDMPVLGSGSVEAARWSVAAAKQGKYFDFHRRLITRSGPKDEDAFSDVAKEAGLDVAQLKKDAGDSKTQEIIDENLKQAGAMGFSGTPGFIIGTEMIRGYIGTDAMEEIIANIRKAAADGGEKAGSSE
ncbi:MAG: thioredoxin domain-containing protein [Alphaproteobacteria bacterium]|nr:thioredoxin domain-containing protein [Alphaproteobacteria bacterium]